MHAGAGKLCSYKLLLSVDICQYPGSKLGQLAIVETHEEIMELVTDYSLVDNEYFFDR